MAEHGGEIPVPASPGSDAIRLSRAVARGDREALAEFYCAWFDRCYMSARALTGRDEAFCLDVVQDAMLRVVRSIRPMRGEEELAAWMSRVVRSAALDAIRRESRRSRREQERAGLPLAVSKSPRGLATDAEETGWARGVLDGLPPEDRALIAERFGRGRTLEEAGAAAGLSGGAAHGRLRRTLARLRSLAREVFDD